MLVAMRRARLAAGNERVRRMGAVAGFENAVIFWLVVAIAAGAIEAATAGLISVWFAIGALVTVLPALLGWSFDAQLVVFIVSSALALFFTRPFFKRVMSVKQTPTNADMIIGEKASVVTAVDNISGQGRVLAGGLEWAARSADGSAIETGAVVEVVALHGVTLTVQKIED